MQNRIAEKIARIIFAQRIEKKFYRKHNGQYQIVWQIPIGYTVFVHNIDTDTAMLEKESDKDIKKIMEFAEEHAMVKNKQETDISVTVKNESMYLKREMVIGTKQEESREDFAVFLTEMGYKGY